jgi:hypothetical protein
MGSLALYLMGYKLNRDPKDLDLKIIVPDHMLALGIKKYLNNRYLKSSGYATDFDLVFEIDDVIVDIVIKVQPNNVKINYQPINLIYEVKDNRGQSVIEEHEYIVCQLSEVIEWKNKYAQWGADFPEIPSITSMDKHRGDLIHFFGSFL